MTWADKLFRKRIDIWADAYDEDHADYHTESGKTGRFLEIDDLVLAVLEKNKKINDETRKAVGVGLEVLEEEQARAWREIVEKSQLLITTNLVKISNKKCEEVKK